MSFLLGAVVPEPEFSPQFSFVGGETAHVSSTYGWAEERHQGIINITYRRTQAVWNENRSFSRMSLGEERDRKKNYLGLESFWKSRVFSIEWKMAGYGKLSLC